MTDHTMYNLFDHVSPISSTRSPSPWLIRRVRLFTCRRRCLCLKLIDLPPITIFTSTLAAVGSGCHISMETVELKVEMVAIHEKRLRKCLSKLKGIEKVEVEASSQKVAVTGCVHRNKVLKALRRGGLKAEFWSAHNEILVNAYARGSFSAFRINNFIRFF